jgi:hypothetical protein
MTNYSIDYKEHFLALGGLIDRDLLPLEDEIKKEIELFKLYREIINTSLLYLGNPIHQSVNEFSGSPSMFTDHGPNHAFSVLKLSNVIYDYLRVRDKIFILSPKEAFVLSCSAWIHDMGMFVQLPGFSKNDIRKFHGKVSGNLFFFIIDNIKHQEKEKKDTGLISMFDLLEREDIKELFSGISLVAAAHQTSFKLSNLKTFHKPELRVVFLGSLLRLADAFDIDKKRADRGFFNFMRNFFGNPTETSVFEWNVNYCSNNNPDDVKIIFDLNFENQFIDYIIQMKQDEYGTVDNLDNLKRRIKENFIRTFKIYIKYYLLDHLNSIPTEIGITELTSLVNTINNWELKFSFKKNGLKFEESFNLKDEEVDKYSRRVYEKKQRNFKNFWISQLSKDSKVTEAFQKLQSAINIQWGSSDIFLFLFDKETDRLRLLSNNSIYKKSIYIKFEGNEIDELVNTTIPLKCGIIGFIAWSGIPEIINTEWKDPRASYTKYDKKLGLNNLLIFNVFDNDKNLLGVMLINFKTEEEESLWNVFNKKFQKYEGKIITSNSIIKDLNCESYFNELIKLFMPYSV